MGAHELDLTAGPLAFFGAELRRFRVAAGLTQEQLAEQVQFSESLVGAVERAKRMPSRQFTELCEEVLGLDGDLLRLWPLITDETGPKWLRQWSRIEAEAHTLRTWQPLIVPSLLQTPAYARAVLGGIPDVSREHLEESLQARLQRQTLFDRPTAPRYAALIDSSVLDRPLGGAEVMRAQVAHLLEMTRHARVTVQIVQREVVPTVGLLGGFAIARFDGGPDTVYLETAGDGEVTDRADRVRTVSVRFDALRAWAHPLHVSAELLREKMAAYESGSA